jgi:hypothetical protein
MTTFARHASVTSMLYRFMATNVYVERLGDGLLLRRPRLIGFFQVLACGTSKNSARRIWSSRTVIQRLRYTSRDATRTMCSIHPVSR